MPFSSTPIPELERFELGANGPIVTGSMAYRIMRMYNDLYVPPKVYPTLASGARVVSTSGTWTLGPLAEIIPSGTFHNNFLIHTLAIETMSKTDANFEFVLYQGNANTEVSRCRFSLYGGFFGDMLLPMPSAIIPKDSVIKGALACSAGLTGAATGTFSVALREIV